MSGIPERFPATGADTAIAITRLATLHRIGMRMRFDARLDEFRLARAVRLTLDAEPILGCSFQTDERHAYWKRLPDLDATEAFSTTGTIDAERDADAFQAIEVGDEGPQVRVVLLRGPLADEIGIKLSHVVADGQAVRQYAYLLADLYTRLGADAGYVPEPNLTPRPSGKDVWANLTPEQRKAAKKAKSWTNPTWSVPSLGKSGEGLTYRTRAFAPEAFLALREYGKARGATVNDMLLAAVLRTCIREIDPPRGVPLSLMCTASLRRFLPDAEHLPISNISISGSLDIERVDGESFDQTLSRVGRRMGVWAQQCYGAGPMVNAEKATVLGYKMTKRLLSATFKMAGRSGKTYPWFTNVGVIDDAQLGFDGKTPVAAYMNGPATSGGSIVPMMSTYRDTLTVCMGFCERDCDLALIESVLAGFAGELEMLRS